MFPVRRIIARLLLATIYISFVILLCLSVFDVITKNYETTNSNANDVFGMRFEIAETEVIAESPPLGLSSARGTGYSAVGVSAQENGNAVPLPLSSEVPFRPFVPNEPKSVILLAYQRTGSSFMGGMFNSNPQNAFYVFEPLDAVYCSLYGTTAGWNVPSDITSYANGTMRIVPDKEIKAVATFLYDLYSCNVDRWPVETYGHPYWNMFRHSASGKFTACVRRNRLTAKSKDCLGKTTFHCGKRFGSQSEQRLDECHRLLTNDSFMAEHQSEEVRQAFQQYIECSKNLRFGAGVCTAILNTTCTERSLRAVKTVRATMDSMEPLLRKLPNFRIIHLIRDPRAVTLSRRRFSGSSRGRYTLSGDRTQMLTSEAMLYCRTVARDVRLRQQLEARYPGRIYSLLYDEVVGDLENHTRKVYRFLDEPVHKTTEAWIGQNLRRERNGTMIANNWQQVLNVEQKARIVEVCSELFSLLQANLTATISNQL